MSRNTTGSVTGYKGVSKETVRHPNKPYKAMLNISRKEHKCSRIYIGHYETPEKARDERIKFIESLK